VGVGRRHHEVTVKPTCPSSAWPKSAVETHRSRTPRRRGPVLGTTFGPQVVAYRGWIRTETGRYPWQTRLPCFRTRRFRSFLPTRPRVRTSTPSSANGDTRPAAVVSVSRRRARNGGTTRSHAKSGY